MNAALEALKLERRIESRPTPPQEIIPLDETINRAVRYAIRRCEGNMVLAAKALGVGKTTIYDWQKKGRLKP